MNEDIMTAVSRIVFYGATWGSVAAVAAGQRGYTRDERMTAAELRRLETGQSRERSRSVLRLIGQNHERRYRFHSLGLTPSTAIDIAAAMKMPVEEPLALPMREAEDAETTAAIVERGQYALPLGNVLQLRTAKAPSRRQRALQHAHAA